MRIAQAIDAERQCCRFVRFTLTVEPDEGPITLDLTGPPGSREFLSALSIMIRSILMFVAAAVLEIAGCFAFWSWLRRGASPLVALIGIASLIGFAVMLTRVDSAFAGRAFARRVWWHLHRCVLSVAMERRRAAPSRVRSTWLCARNRRRAGDHLIRAKGPMN